MDQTITAILICGFLWGTGCFAGWKIRDLKAKKENRLNSFRSV